MKFLFLITSVALFFNGTAAYSKNEWEELTEAFKKTITTLKSETSTLEDKRKATKALFDTAKDLSTFKDSKKKDKEKISNALQTVFRLYENNVFNLLSPDKEISGKAPKEIVDIAEKTAQQVSAFYYLMENLGEIIEDTQGKKNKNKPLEAKTEKKIEEVFEHLGKLGVFFGKTAQSVSNLDFMFGKYAERLRPYQDKFGEELEYEVIAEIFKKNTGKTIEESYASFDKKPIARGSIAQTHTAKLHSGEDVVVKFKRPGLLESLQADTKILTAYFEMMKAIAKDASEVRSLEFIHEQLLGLAEGYASETDFKTEFEILKNLNKRFSNGQIVIPRPYAELSGEDVITMKKL